MCVKKSTTMPLYNTMQLAAFECSIRDLKQIPTCNFHDWYIHFRCPGSAIDWVLDTSHFHLIINCITRKGASFSQFKGKDKNGENKLVNFTVSKVRFGSCLFTRWVSQNKVHQRTLKRFVIVKIVLESTQHNVIFNLGEVIRNGRGSIVIANFPVAVISALNNCPLLERKKKCWRSAAAGPFGLIVPLGSCWEGRFCFISATQSGVRTLVVWKSQYWWQKIYCRVNEIVHTIFYYKYKV